MDDKLNSSPTIQLNTYCTRVGLSSTPNIDELVKNEKVKAFHLMVCIILEQGNPMTLNDIAKRLNQTGYQPAQSDWLSRLKKCWGGREPIYFNQIDGTYSINFDSYELRRLLKFKLKLIPLNIKSHPEVVIDQPALEIPLSLQEIEAALSYIGNSTNVSTFRKVIAVLDTQKEPLSLKQVEAVLNGISQYRSNLIDNHIPPQRKELVAKDENGFLKLNRESPELLAVRMVFRDYARRTFLQEARKIAFDNHWAEYKKSEEITKIKAQKDLAQTKKALIQVVNFDDDTFAAISILDIKERIIHSFKSAEITKAIEYLNQFDIVIGVEVRNVIASLNLDSEKWRLIDISPPQKKKTINKSGRKLNITLNLLISGTTGISHPLGDPVKISQYLEEGSYTKLFRRMESDIKSLFAFYSYGILHNCVRLRWGFLDQNIRVEWALPGEEHYYEVLKQAAEHNSMVEVVTGSAPGWENPWARVKKARIVKSGVYEMLSVRLLEDDYPIANEEIQAIRIINN